MHGNNVLIPFMVECTLLQYSSLSRVRTRRRAGGERHDIAACLRVDGGVDGGQDLVVAGADRLRHLHAVRRHQSGRGRHGGGRLGVGPLLRRRPREHQRRDGRGEPRHRRRGVGLGVAGAGLGALLLPLLLDPRAHRLPLPRATEQLRTSNE
jgi:hypothetical protein